SLVLSKPGEQDQAMALGLRQIGEFVGAERAALWHIGPDIPFGVTQQWNADGFAGPATEGKVPDLPWIYALIRRGDVVRIAHLADLPPEGQADADTLRHI